MRVIWKFTSSPPGEVAHVRESGSNARDCVFHMKPEAASDAEGVLRGPDLVRETICREPFQRSTNHPCLDVRIASFISGRVPFSPAKNRTVEALRLALRHRLILSIASPA